MLLPPPRSNTVEVAVQPVPGRQTFASSCVPFTPTATASPAFVPPSTNRTSTASVVSALPAPHPVRKVWSTHVPESPSQIAAWIVE
jgi:hypothetical protein